jgi:cell division GTPase FtsZ
MRELAVAAARVRGPATRIREEVADANIMVGATFDDSLDGAIRVSVVATGLDIKTADSRPTGCPWRPRPHRE